MLRISFASRCVGFALLAGLATAACGDDDDSSSPTGGTGGKGGSTSTGGHAGSTVTGGTAGVGGTVHVGGTVSVGGTEAESGAPGETGGAGADAGGVGGEGGGGGAGGAPITLTDVVTTKLTADKANGTAKVDGSLVNPWGLAFDPDPAGDAAFWVSAQGSGVSTIYGADGVKAALVVTIPAAAALGTGSPTGQVYNTSAGFDSDKFIFATTDGLIAGWKAGAVAVKRADVSADDAEYTGLALVDGATPWLLAANFHNATVDIFDGDYATVDNTDLFVDPTLPDGYAPFNVAVSGAKVFVAYAKQDADATEEVAGAGLGYVSVFKTDGTFTKRLASGGTLNAPWGLALAPSLFTPAPSALIVGNFGDGKIHAFDPATGELISEFAGADDKPLVIDGLWSLAFGPKKTGADMSLQLFFTAGPGEEAHGLFGNLSAP